LADKLSTDMEFKGTSRTIRKEKTNKRTKSFGFSQQGRRGLEHESVKNTNSHTLRGVRSKKHPNKTGA